MEKIIKITWKYMSEKILVIEVAGFISDDLKTINNF